MKAALRQGGGRSARRAQTTSCRQGGISRSQNEGFGRAGPKQSVGRIGCFVAVSSKAAVRRARRKADRCRGLN